MCGPIKNQLRMGDLMIELSLVVLTLTWINDSSILIFLLSSIEVVTLLNINEEVEIYENIAT